MTAKFAPLWFLVSLAVLSLLVPVTLVLTTLDIGRSRAWQGTLLILVYAGIRLSYLIARGEPRMYTFSWFLFSYIFLGLAPTVQIRSGLVPITTPGMLASIDSQIVNVLVGSFVTWEIGAALSRATDRRRVVLNARRSECTQPTRRVKTTRATLSGPEVSRTRLRGVTLIALLAVLFYAATVGPSSIFATRDILDARRRSAFGDPTVAVIASTLAIYVPLLVAQARRWLPIEDVQPHSLENRCATVTFAAITVIVANPVGNARYVSGTILLSMLFLSGAFGNVRRSRWSFWIVIAGFIFVFPLFNSFRRGTGGLSRNGFFGEYAGNGDYDAFYQIGNAISYVAARGADDGLQLLGVLLFWVPRSVWSSKPLDTGTLLANFRGYSFGNLSAPIWAEFLVNFGLAGLFAGIFFVGFVISRADVFLGGLASENSIAVFRNSVIPFYLFIILRGSLLQAMAGLVTLVVFTYVLLPRHRLAHRV